MTNTVLNITLEENWIIVNAIINDEANIIVFKCNICKSGFKMCENTEISCMTHPNDFVMHAAKFSCCGQSVGSIGCVIGYHSLSDYDFKQYLKLKKDK